MRAPNITQQVQDPAVDAYVAGIVELTDTWISMLWLTTMNPRIVTTRREIARWARNTNQEFMDTFGRATASEEIRVILDGLVSLLPKQLGDEGRALLTRITVEAQALAAEGREAVASF